MKNSKKIFNFFKPIVKKNIFLALVPAILFGLGNIFINIISPIYYKKIIDIATDQVSEGLFSFSKMLQPFYYVLGLLFGGYFLYRISSFLYTSIMDKMSLQIDEMSFGKIQNKNYTFFVNNFTGALTNKIKRIASNFRNIYDTLIFGFFLLFLDISLTLFVLFKENTLLGYSFLFFIVLSILLSLVYIKKQALFGQERAAYASKATGVLSDIISNIFNMKIFSTEDSEKKYYNKVIGELSSFRLKSWRYQDRVRVYKSIFFFTFEVSTIGLTLYLFTQQKITIGVFILVQAYLTNIIRSVWVLDKNLTRFIEVQSDTIDAIDVFDSDLVIKNREQIEEPQMTNGDINFGNVCFTYVDGDHVFEKFNLHIPAGQSVGIVGKSGSGKTTLTTLLLRFYDVDSGQITIDGQNIADITQSDLRKNIAYIPQETVLFHRSIYENIEYGNLNASEQEVLDSADSAYVDEFVQNLDEKYETKVGERGVKLSGGQRQRIGIARAMLRRKAPILILDEATSSLDSMSEHYIQKSFKKLSQNRTTIVIAHRLSTIQEMDRIIVMEKGKIIEDGSHSQLIKNGGHYAELWNSQVNGFIQD